MNLIELALVAVAPTVFHYAILWGESILDPVKVLPASLGGIFNAYPLAFCAIAGLSGAVATTFASPWNLFFWLIAGLSAVVDVVMSVLSFMGMVRRK